MERLERARVNALKADDWVRAKRLLDLRRELSPRLRDSQEDLATLASLAEGGLTLLSQRAAASTLDCLEVRILAVDLRS